MKRLLFYIWISLVPFMCQGQNVLEYLQVVTDRNLYITGERLYVSVRVVDDGQNPLDMSKVAYVELCDKQKAHVQFMIALKDGQGWGDVLLPATMHSGNYELSVYTSYMKNFGPDCFYRKNLGVVNLNFKSPEDNLVWEEGLPSISVSSDYPIHTDKPIYGKRSQIKVQLPIECQGHATLSVRRLDMEMISEKPTPKVQSYVGEPSTDYLPEPEGHLLSVQAAEGTGSLAQVQLGVMGLNTHVADGKRFRGNEFLLPMYGVYGHQHVALAGFDSQNNLIPVTIKSPYAQCLPGELPSLKVKYDEMALKYRLLASQLQGSIVPQRDLQQRFTVEGREPSYIYNLSEYTPMKSIHEALVEFVEGIKYDKYKGSYALFTTTEEFIGYSNQPALVLLDGVPVQDIDKLMEYDARRIHYILIYRGKYTFGDKVQEGVISFTTYSGELPSYQLTENERLYEYDFPQNRPSFNAEEYGNSTEVSTERPDFRSLLYWNPQVKGDAVSFYSSDMTGKYEIELTTYNSLGEEKTYLGYFEVQ
ncbi:MAG: hypothetical protein IJ212_02400 [Bacteroidaceae bacterium]|nr:hypothetical protein [Bacteroidaceae bacterium]